MKEVVLRAPFDQLWKNCDPFVETDRLEGEEFRRVKCRRTFRIEIAGKGYFVKRHHGVGWQEIFKNLFQFKLPVLGAQNEFRAIELLHQLNIPTMTAAAYGRYGINPARMESFLVTEELADMPSLEDYTKNWSQNPPSYQEKAELTVLLAQEVGGIHRAGINHRDCYICHFLLDRQTRKLHVIDLHRSQLRAKVPFRYQVKDVAGIFFSSLDLQLTRRDVMRFIRNYDAPGSWHRNKKFWRAVDKAARKLYFKEFHRPAPEVLP